MAVRMVEGNILVTVFTMSQLRLQIRPNTFARLTGDFCTKCHSSLMDVVCSGPKKHC